MGEFGLIARITRRLTQGAGVELGPGDDAAVVRAPDGRVVATSDLLVQEEHFRLDWSAGYDVGRKAAAQNLADVAAMGARPTGLLVGLGLPPGTEVSWVEELYDGLRDECDVAGASVVGGDVVRAPVVVIAVTALGDLAGERPLTRSGARPGDVVAVRGRLGFAAAGLALLTAGAEGPAELIAAHRRPRPPYDAGPEAVRLGATALLDVSDGLVQDLGHIAEASGVRIELDAAALPVPAVLGPDGRHHVLTGGEDHAIAGTFPADVPLPGRWRVIGWVAEGEGVTVDGVLYGRGGWDHFA
ncbi:thiamine-phosphate kinase [Actinomadura scrupuli]|uniref:thiamine-phosphate kinase n=1 Tax=Actinomadura scrupuli TaxID=559629 RepID=UPI003D95721C